MQWGVTSVAACSCWHNNKVVVQYWESELVGQFYSNAILFCLTPPTAALYPSSPVMFLLLFESHFVTWSLLVVFHLQLPPAFFILVLSYFFYYSSLYTQGWNLQAGRIPLCLGLGMKISTSVVPISVASAEHMIRVLCS